MRIGYFLSTEEYSPAELVAQAAAAEKAGFSGLWISDHFHPWNNEQGNSPWCGASSAPSVRCAISTSRRR